MLHRVYRPLVKLLRQRRFYLLLVLLWPLMFSLHWMAVRFPICFPDYINATVYEVEPDKLAVVLESYGPRGRWGAFGDSASRAWLLDIEAETFTPIACPREVGPSWPSLLGKDSQGNLIFETRSGIIKYVSWNARTGEVFGFSRLPNKPVMINSRYLACVDYSEHVNPKFTWIDLLEPNYPQHSVPIMEAGVGLIPIAGADSFYFGLPAEERELANGLDSGISMMGMAEEGTDEVPPIDYSAEWTNDDGSVEYELPPVVVNPSTPIPRATVVLMKLTEHGPKEVTRWPVLSLDSFAISAGPGYIVSQTLDAQFLETRDATTGKTVSRIPIPKSALATTGDARLDDFTTVGGITYFYDTGSCRVFDSKTGKSLSSIPPLGRLVLSAPGQYMDEYLTWLVRNYPKDWPGELQLRSGQSHEVLASWKLPDWNVWVSNQPEDRVHFSHDGKKVLFYTGDLRVLIVDKATGKLERHIQPRFWLPYLAASLGLATLVWFALWIHTSIRSGLSHWVDELMIFAISMTFIYWRINLSGPYDRQRLAWICLGAMLVSALVYVVNQTMFRKVRLLYRCAPVTLLSVAAIFWQWKWVHFAQPSDILAEVLLMFVIVLSSIGAHFLFFRKQRAMPVASDAVHGRFTLAELFAWTALVALMLAPLRLYDWDDWMRGVSMEWLLETLCVAGVITAVALSAHYLTAMRCNLVFRLLGGCVLAVLIAVSVAYRQNLFDVDSNVIGSISFRFFGIVSECLLAMAVGSFLVALPVGLRSSKGKTLLADAS
jgi:hypothetical protein